MDYLDAAFQNAMASAGYAGVSAQRRDDHGALEVIVMATNTRSFLADSVRHRVKFVALIRKLLWASDGEDIAFNNEQLQTPKPAASAARRAKGTQEEAERTADYRNYVHRLYGPP